MLTWLSRRSTIRLVTAFAFSAILLLTLQHHDYVSLPTYLEDLSPFSFSAAAQSARIRNSASRTLGDTHVVIWDREFFHDEVHGSLMYTLSQYTSNVRTSLYRPGWRWDFNKVIASWWTEKPKEHESFWAVLKTDKSIRHIFLPTFDFADRWALVQDELRAEWSRREPSERFTIIGVHHWGDHDMSKNSAWWAERDSLSLVSLGDHVTGCLRKLYQHAAETGDFTEAEKAGLKRMRIETFVPVFPPDELEHVSEVAQKQADAEIALEESGGERKPSLDVALIQCSKFDEEHRGIADTLKELSSNIRADPAIWGFKISNEGEIVPDDSLSSTTTRFELQLVGGDFVLPKDLQHVVRHILHPPYPVYFDSIHQSDLVLPAFGEGISYDIDRASSTMGVAASALSPVATTEFTANAYGWFCPAFVAIRPSGMTEMEYIRQVRAGLIPWKSKTQVQNDLAKCRYDWTTRNMQTFATLFAVPPVHVSQVIA